MAKYLKKFETTAEYNSYMNGRNLVLPNVSLCVDENQVHYTPFVKVSPVVTATFNVSYGTDVCLYHVFSESGEEITGLDMFESITISDGTTTTTVDIEEIEVPQDGGYMYLEEGIYTITYVFKETDILPTFSANEFLTGITFGEGVTSFGVFEGCYNLESVYIPSTLRNYSWGGFYGCGSLTSLVVSPNNTFYDSRNNCNAIIDTETNTLIAGCSGSTIPSGVVSIGNYAFSGISITTITIPSGVTSIDDYAFYDCVDLESVSLPNTLTTIDACAFIGCASLETITIPASVTTMDTAVFAGCSNLTSATVLATTPPSVNLSDGNIFDGCSSLTHIYVPSASVNAYKAATGWSEYASIIEAIP